MSRSCFRRSFTWTCCQLTAHGANAAAWLDSISATTDQPFAAVVSSTPFAFALAIGAVGSHRPIAPLGARLTVAEVAATLSGLAPSIVVTEPEAEAVVRASAEPLGLRVEVHLLSMSSRRGLPLQRNVHLTSPLTPLTLRRSFIPPEPRVFFCLVGSTSFLVSSTLFNRNLKVKRRKATIY